MIIECFLGYFTDVTADFQSKMPVISAVVHYEEKNYRLHIIVNSSDSVETSQLLSVYSQLDPRVRPLVISFRYWAKVSSFVNFTIVDTAIFALLLKSNLPLVLEVGKCCRCLELRSVARTECVISLILEDFL